MTTVTATVSPVPPYLLQSSAKAPNREPLPQAEEHGRFHQARVHEPVDVDSHLFYRCVSVRLQSLRRPAV